MNAFAKLLFGDEAARALDLLAGDDNADRADESVGARRVRRSGAWCGTTPDTLGGITDRAARPR